jgi:hypothetical protein
MILPQLSRVMEAFARHWASHPEQLLTDSLTILAHPANLPQSRARREAA